MKIKSKICSTLSFLAILIYITTDAVAQTTHIGQQTPNHVMLHGSTTAIVQQICNFDRIMPDGSREAFKIPADKRLIITDVEWQTLSKFISGGPYNGWANQFTPGDAVWLEIQVSGEPLFSSRTISVQTEGNGIGSSEQLTTGFIVQRERFCGRVRVKSDPLPSDLNATWAGNFGEGFLILRGYLIDV